MSAGRSAWGAVAVAFVLPAAVVRAGPAVSNLVAAYEPIASVRCDVRREVAGPHGTVRRLSRVVWARPERLYSENFSPVRRRVVSDGTNFFSHVEGDPFGFSRPVAELDEDMRRPLSVVPGSPMDLLLRWVDAPEREEAPISNGWRRVVVDGQPPGSIVMDEAGRPVRIEVVRSEGGISPLAVWTYDRWVRTPSGVWIATRHEAVMTGGSEPLREVTFFENYRADVTVAATEFQEAIRAFRNVRFTNEWSAIYGSATSER